MFRKIALISALFLTFSPLACAGDNPNNTTKPASTTTAPTTTTPQKPSHSNNMTASSVCKSGSRTVSYDYDAKTGILSASATFDKCLLADGTSISGASSIEGTLLTTGKTGYNVDITDQIDTTITGKTGLVYTRKCTLVRKGTLDTKTQVFSGSIQRNNCGLSGDFRETRDFVEHLLKHNTYSEEGENDNTTSTSGSR